MQLLSSGDSRKQRIASSADPLHGAAWSSITALEMKLHSCREGNFSSKWKVPQVENSSSPRYQPFDANPDQTTDRHLAASNRFCEIFDEFALYSENA